MLEAASGGGQERVAGPAAHGLSARPARSAAIDVPGFRFVASRAADAAHRDDPVRVGVLRIRADLHVAFLRRQTHRRLRAVQFRNLGARAALRGHPQRGVSRSRSRRITMPSWSSISVCRRRPACRWTGCRRSIDGVRIIGIDVPGFGVPTHAEAKDVLAGAMLRYARREAESWPGRSGRAAVAGPADGDVDRRAVPGRSGRRRCVAGADGSGGRAVKCRRANGATCTARWTAQSPRRCILSTPHRSASCKPPAGPVVGSGPVGVEGTAAWLDAVGAASRMSTRIDAAKARCAAGDPRRDDCQPDQRACHRLGLRGLRAAGRATADRSRRRSALCRHRLPPDRMERGRPRLAGGPRHARSVPRLAGAGRCRDGGRQARPRGRHHASGAEGKGARHSRRCISPTWSRRGRCSGRPGAGALAAIVAAQTKGRERFPAW